MIRKDKFFIAIILALMISNIFLIYSSFNKGPRLNKEPKNIIIKKLKLDDKQVKQYELLIETHLNNIRAKEQELMLIKKEFNQLHRSTANASTLDSLSTVLGDVHKDLEMINFQHIEDIKGICNQDQISSYNDLLNELGQMFAGPPRAKPRKR